MMGGNPPSAYPGPCMLQLLAVLGGLMASVSGVIITKVPDQPIETGNVLFNVSVTGIVRYYDWYKGNSTEAAKQIVRYDTSGDPKDREVPGTSYFSEAKIYPNGSLEIRNLQKKFEGNYTVAIQTTAEFLQQTVELKVSSSPSVPLSAGIIAAISIAAIGAAVIIGATICVMLKKKKGKSEGPL